MQSTISRPKMRYLRISEDNYNGGSIFHTMLNWPASKSCLALVVPSTISLIQGLVLIGRVNVTLIPVEEVDAVSRRACHV
jgi:hypothetical protein